MTVSLSPFQLPADLDLLARWLEEPHVQRWWGDSKRNLVDAKNRTCETHALIAIDAKPVGYLRWQPVSLSDLAILGITDIPAGSIDVDILIGERELLGKGIGSCALQLLLDRLRMDGTIPLAGMSTRIENHAAIRSYEKAGFRRRHRYYDPQFGECWIMATNLLRKDTRS